MIQFSSPRNFSFQISTEAEQQFIMLSHSSLFSVVSSET